MKINNMFKILLVMLLASMFISSVYATGAASVVLSSQDPDPVKPGNYVDLSFTITNSGDSAISNARLELIENTYITRAPSEPQILELGAIPAFATEENGFTVAKVRVFVDELTPIGSQEVDVRIRTNSQEFIRTFFITVRQESPSLTLESTNTIEELTFKPGEQKELKLQLKNTNSISVKDIKLTLDTTSEDALTGATSNDFYIIGGTNVRRVNVINSGDSQEVNFNLGISPTASIAPYQIPITLEYTDVLGNSFTENVEVSILVNSPVDLIVTLDRIEQSKVTFGLANPGPGVVKGAFVEIRDSSNEEIASEYIGDLNADDFQTIQIDYNFGNKTSEEVTVHVDFADGFYSEQEKEKAFTLTNNAAQAQGGSSTFVFVLIIIAIAVGGYFIFRRRK